MKREQFFKLVKKAQQIEKYFEGPNSSTDKKEITGYCNHVDTFGYYSEDIPFSYKRYIRHYLSMLEYVLDDLDYKGYELEYNQLKNKFN